MIRLVISCHGSTVYTQHTSHVTLHVAHRQSTANACGHVIAIWPRPNLYVVGQLGTGLQLCEVGYRQNLIAVVCLKATVVCFVQQCDIKISVFGLPHMMAAKRQA